MRHPQNNDPSAAEVRFVIQADDVDPLLLLGPADANLNALSRRFQTRIVMRDGVLRLSGPKEEQGELTELFQRLLARCRAGEALNPELVAAEAERLRSERSGAQKEKGKSGDKSLTGNVLSVRTPRKTIVAKTPNQRSYLQAIAEKDIVFAIGPAGTGKTYLAVAVALEALVSGRASRIILTRPAVEAGESLGYLPGTFKEKIDPYLRPLYDALFDMMPLERVKMLIEQEVIEVAPLAFMRGRTLSDAYIILDEAQNTTSSQMKMFLTRLGWNSKAIVTGDITQIDLAHQHTSGLVEAEELLRNCPGIAVVRFDEGDVVRPPLVSRIIRAYEKSQGQKS
ncbi:MAG: PhoH family protein [candidate division WOR-3 bacterium]